MPTTPGGVWTPDDTDDWDLTVDLAAMAVSIDDSVSAAIEAIPENYRIGPDSERISLSGADLFDGLRWYSTDTRVEWIRQGQWKPVASVTVKGTATGPSISPNTYTSSWATINFPAGTFLAPPLVFLTVIEETAIQRMVVSVQSRTATSAVITVRNVSGGAATPTVQWMAVSA